MIAAKRYGSMALAGLMLAVLLVRPSAALAQAGPNPSARGKYLVEFGGFVDCHTPGHFFGKPDVARALAGSEVGFEIPGLGVFYRPNLTPDKETGLGNCTKQQIVRRCRRERDPTDVCLPRSCRGAPSPS